MPRGQRKKGQFDLKLWFFRGGHIRFYTERNLTADEWKESMDEHIRDLQRVVDGAYAREKEQAKA